jgi:hypothetical protein
MQTPSVRHAAPSRCPGQRLAAAGLRYADARAVAATAQLGTDLQSVRRYRRRHEPNPQDTGPLVAALLDGPPNRATRLLALPAGQTNRRCPTVPARPS